ncbi:MAG: hypothetical protein RL637_1506, partial [Pseudomonadota bacterium]
MYHKTIGILGGMGPKSGTDLANKIIKNTLANCDQQHIPFILISQPHLINDRTEFLLGKNNINPAEIIYQQIKQLALLGADIIGLPCNTAHSPAIMDRIVELLTENDLPITLVNMIEAVVEYIVNQFPLAKKIGLLATQGTYQSGIYTNALNYYGLELINPPLSYQHLVHQAIYHPQYGIKSTMGDDLTQAADLLKQVCQYFISLNVDVIILGCT